MSAHKEPVFLVDIGDRYPNHELLRRLRHYPASPCDHSGTLALFASLAEAFNLALNAQEHAEALAMEALPVLRWVRHPSGWVADLGLWRLFACDGRWTLRYCWSDDWCRTMVEAPRGYAGDAAESRRACEAALRRSGVAFRVEDGAP